MRRPPTAVVLVGSFAVGSVPVSNLASRWRTGRDLRNTGTGTVSGSALYEVAGFAPLAVAGILEVGKGALGPWLAGPDRPGVAAAAGGLAVAGHNWSPMLGGAGGRGISPAIGALLVQAWPGAVVLLAGLAGGRLAHETALGSFVSYVVLAPVTARTHGRRGARAAAAVLAPIVVKRLLGNGPPPGRRPPGLWWNRLLFDRDRAAP